MRFKRGSAVATSDKQNSLYEHHSSKIKRQVTYSFSVAVPSLKRRPWKRSKPVRRVTWRSTGYTKCLGYVHNTHIRIRRVFNKTFQKQPFIKTIY